MVGAGPRDGVRKEPAVVHRKMLVRGEIWWENVRNLVVGWPTVTEKRV